MSIVKTLGTFFRTSAGKPVDKYSILTPLMASGEYLTQVLNLISTINTPELQSVLIGKNANNDRTVSAGVSAYRDYIRGLPNRDQMSERTAPFSTVVSAIAIIQTNILQIEDNFQALFGGMTSSDATMKASSLVVLGYMERVDSYATWLTMLCEHLAASENDSVPPFRTKMLLSGAADMAQFATANLHTWNSTNTSVVAEVKNMQRQGKDLTMQSGDAFIDDYAHDNQFSPAEQELLTASLRNPAMMVLATHHLITQWWADVLTSRKEWLTAKILLEQAKARNMDPGSPEYRKLQKACDHYAALISKYERHIERAQ
jgi:hypothetical protein